ncbi:MAG: hypothetical protein IRZ13_19545 [Acetobacteraceae bacterium]|nr:hypothetical protein [Acetobacteraceae bacterium]
MIAYFIQIHGKFEHFEWLFSLLYSEENYYFISADAEPEQVERLRASITAGRSNVVVVESAPVVWGGMSVVTSILRGISLALEQPGWSHFVNLSGSDVPLRSQGEIRNHLLAWQERHFDSFVGYFGSRAPDWSCDRDEATAELREELAAFPAVVAAGDLAAALRDNDRSPVMRWYRRPAVYAEENILERRLRLRWLTPQELTVRRALFERHLRSYRGGRQWFVFSRPLCEWIADSERTALLAELLRNTLIPDEAFFQTLLEFAPAALKARIHPNNLRFRNGDPIQLTDDALPFVRDSDALFARKFTMWRSERIRALFAERAAGLKSAAAACAGAPPEEPSKAGTG